MRLIARLLVLCLPLLSLPGLAATLGDLYQVREPVASQQPEERDAALARALETLVLRLTGSRDAAQSPALAELRKDPQQIVSQYGYEGDSLLVDFDPLSTDRHLRQAGLALWGANRPAIVAWWLNEGIGGASLVGDGQDSAAALRRAAQHRGLPLRLPLADLGEQLLATPDSLGAKDPEALRAASERYAADALLAVQAREVDGQWQAQWRLWLGDGREQGKALGADPNALADAVFLAVSERLAPRFVVAPGAASSLTLEVQGVDLARYAELQRTLEPLGAQLSRVQGDRVVYRINASAEQLRAQLGLLRLQEVAADSVPVDAGQPPAPQVIPRTETLRFRW
ncbi:DUF2066 domain-containing protein [Pseudomonas lalucatii]|uniref:DUF2066 domain-containing protein n=1 Tax=Pseudomonas lalucatii TaxID=1424203 RepID=A0ABS5Q3M8_9PSED|nr:DUF2066 domain-containing protein [Pseudomonas lalucatii]MBS7663347.1 DUF2066 domain-containing protein [Pseudomonas lalucatii]QVM87060.1 DUF2066 domain-containing protein [Pseudomonas lalucatii]